MKKEYEDHYFYCWVLSPIFLFFNIQKGYSNGVDLFSLPSKLLDHSERIMAAHPHGFASPYHLLATENNFFLLDQRFPGTPVSKG